MHKYRNRWLTVGVATLIVITFIATYKSNNETLTGRLDFSSNQASASASPSTRSEALAILMKASKRPIMRNPQVQTFADVPPTHPYFVHIEQAVADNLIAGNVQRGVRNFRADSYMTRAEFATLANAVFGLKDQTLKAGYPFISDNGASTWYQTQVNTLYRFGGVETAFRPGDSITTTEASASAKSLAQRALYTSRGELAEKISDALYLPLIRCRQGVARDVSSAHPHCPAIQAAISAGIFSGYADGTFDPAREMTRAEVAVVLANAFDLGSSQNETLFADDAAIPAWSRGAVAALNDTGAPVADDENRFNPVATATSWYITDLVDFLSDR